MARYTGRKLTLRNPQLGTEAVVIVPLDGILTPRQVERTRSKLQGIPGAEGTGFLGEQGPQTPPEIPGWCCRSYPTANGGAQIVSERIPTKTPPHPAAETSSAQALPT